MTAPGTDSRPAVGITRPKSAVYYPTGMHSRGVGRPGMSVPVATVECCAEEHPAPPGGDAPFHRRGPPVTYIRPHYRRDGTYVKGHNRRTRPRTAQPRTAPRRTAQRPRPVPTGPTAYVRPYYRTDGTRVRGHRRSISPRTIAVLAGTGGGGLMLLLLLLALASGPGSSSKAPAGTTPSLSASVPATHHR